ncbi:MAG TPA: helix-turn-helix domain-containing protein [Ktedonobacterales bacterium]
MTNKGMGNNVRGSDAGARGASRQSRRRDPNAPAPEPGTGSPQPAHTEPAPRPRKRQRTTSHALDETRAESAASSTGGAESSGALPAGDAGELPERPPSEGMTPSPEQAWAVNVADGQAGGSTPRGRKARERPSGSRSNALGGLIERRFSDPTSPVRSYSELERRSGISREALSRYVTPRADRRRSPSIDTLAAISDAMHMSLEQVCRAAAASARGASLPSEAEQHARDEVVAPLIAPLTDDQFSAVVELLRQMQSRLSAPV